MPADRREGDPVNFTCVRTSLVLLLVVCAEALAQSPRVDVLFQREQLTQPGMSLFVLGSLPELGAWDVRYAVKLEQSDYPSWKVRVSLPANRDYAYIYVLRDDGAGQLGNWNNADYVTSVLNDRTPPASPARSASNKLVVIEGTLENPTLFYRDRGTFNPYLTVPLEDVGNGSEPGSVRWAATGLGLEDEGMDFYALDSTGLRVPSTGFFSTALDEAYVKDDELFSYVPPETTTPQLLLANRSYASAILGESRTVRILLPRNYGQVPGMRYPVLYMHDGQGLFGTGRKWMVEQAASEQTRSGKMREIIVVGIDNSGFDNRFRDYVPNGDTSSYGDGDADSYSAFIRDELKPQIDAEFLTIDKAGTTGTMGSSLGGVCSLYQGWAWGDTFRRVGALSGAWPFSVNFNQTLDDAAPSFSGLRVYLDSGDAGPGLDNFGITTGVRDTLLARDEAIQTFSIEGNLRYRVGFGDEHDEYAWARRLPGALAFLYPVNEDASGLKTLEFVVRGDANTDGTLNPEDLYTFDSEPSGDFDNDGLDGTDADRAFLLDLLRSHELDDID